MSPLVQNFDDSTFQGTTLIQWIVDTRPLWPEAVKTQDLEQTASRALALLTPSERAAVLRFYHLRDAKLSLASHLLKRHAIARFCCVPWSQALPIRDERTSKPIWRDEKGHEPLHFNVSHQNGIVALIAVHGARGAAADVGVDVVCTSERRDRDLEMIASEGWSHFVDVHADVLSDGEVSYLKHGILTPSSAVPNRPGPDSLPTHVADFQLRCFYALWCLREAYVKMTGEALLAPWLGDLEFRGFRPPDLDRSSRAGGLLAAGDPQEGTAVRTHDIYFRGQKVQDASVCLKSLGPDYMVCAAVRFPAGDNGSLNLDIERKLGSFESISMEDLISSAKSQK